MRFKVTKGGCWAWLGHRDANGYGHVQIGKARMPAHRAAYALFVGPIPAGWQVHHHCRNRHCINPEHLEATPPETHRSYHPHMTDRPEECIWGHPFDEANTYYRRVGDRIERQCRKCKARRERERQGKLRREAGKPSRFPAVRKLDEQLLEEAKAQQRERTRRPER